MTVGRVLVPLLLWGLGATAGCEDKKEQLVEKVAGPSASNTEPPPPPRPPPDRVPDISIDPQGLYMGGERANLSAQDGPKKLAEITGKYQLAGKTVAVSALRNARTPHVAAVVQALAAQGASEILIRTQDRAHKETSLKLTPEGKLGKIPDCTVVTMMLKDRTTASWSIRGGVATKYPRGMAGPDMSLTLEGITKQVDRCPSTALLFSGDDSVDWGLTFDLALNVASAQPPLKITTYTLPREAPVAGRPVKLAP
jgi:biopolymer transport protein ExbD